MLSNEPKKPVPIVAIALALAVAAGGLLALHAEAQSTCNDVKIEKIEFLDAPNLAKEPVVEVTSKIRATLVNNCASDSGALAIRYYWRVESNENFLNDHNDSVRNQQESTVQIPLGMNGKSRLVTSGSTDRSWWPSERQAGRGVVIAVLIRGESQLTGPFGAEGARLHSLTLSTLVRSPAVEVIPDYSLPKQDENGQYRHPTDPCEAGKVMNVSCKILPGRTAIFRVTAHNLGNFQDFFNPNVTGTIPDGWYVNFTPLKRVPSNESYFLVVTAPKTGHANAEVGKGLNTGNTQTAFTIARSDAKPSKVSDKKALPHVLVAQEFKLNASQQGPKRFGNITEPLTFNLTVQNDGNGPDDYYVEFQYTKTNVTKDWTPTFSLDATTRPDWIKIDGLRPGKNKTVQLTVTAPPKTPTGVYPFTVKVQSNKTDFPLRDRRFFEYSAQINQTFSLTGATAGATVRQTVPAETAGFEIILRNEGNGMDNVTLSLETVQPEGGFSARLNKNRVPVPAYGEARAFLNVTSTPRLQEGRFVEIFVNATSQGPREVDFDLRPRVHFRFRVDTLKGSNVVLSSPDTGTTKFVDPGKTLTYTIEARNLGNMEDNATVTIERTNLEWAATVTPECSSVPGCLNLKHTDSQPKRITVTLTAPANADVSSRGGVRLRVTPDSNDGKLVNLTFNARASGADLAVTGLSVSPSEVYADRDATLSVDVGNVGNRGATGAATLRVIATNQGSEHVLHEERVDNLVAGRRASVRVPLNASTLSLEGATTIRAVFDPATSLAPEGEVREIDETNNARQITTFVRRLSLKVLGAEGLSAHPGQRVAYIESPNAFVVENTGNAIERVWANVTSGNGWGASREERELRPGERAVFGVVLDVPAAPGASEDTLTFTLAVANRPDFRRSATAKTTLVDTDPPTIVSLVATPIEVTVGGRTNLTARFEDAIGIAGATLHYRTPLNETKSVTLKPIGGNAYAYEHAFDIVGAYRAWVEVRDRAPRPNVNSSVEAPISFTVKAGSAPAISLGIDPKTPVRSGTGVPILATDPLGVGRVTYVIAEIEYATERPYKIDTTGFANGRVDVLVKAQNVYGVESRKSFTLTIDNQAPAKGVYAVSPDPPRPGEEATITLRTEADVQKATALVKRAGATEQLEMEKTGTGVFRLKFTPEEGDYVIDFVLQDAAGNVRTDDRAVAFAAEAGLFAPAAGPLVLAGLVAAVAFAVGRRRRS